MENTNKETFIKRWDYSPEGRRLFWFELRSSDGIRWHQTSLKISFLESPPPIRLLYNRLLNPKTTRERLDFLALRLFKEITLAPEYKNLFNSVEFSESYYRVLERIERINKRASEFTISDFAVLTPYSKYSNPDKFNYIVEHKNNQNEDIVNTYEINRSEFESIITLAGFQLQEGYVEVFTKSKSILYKHLIINNSYEGYLMETTDKEPIFFFYTSLY